VPYAWASQPGAAYTGRQLASELVRIIQDFHPDTVIGPDGRETHPDHASVAAFTLYALDEAGFTGTRLTAFVHFKHYPYPWAHLPGTALNPPPQLLSPGTAWLALLLDSADNAVKIGLLKSVDLTGFYDLTILNGVLTAAGQPTVGGS